MNPDIVKYLIIQIILILIQVFICNNIMLFNIAIGFVFIFPIISMPMNISQILLLTFGFFAGLLVDICSDTPGVNALSCVLLAMIKRPSLYAYIPKDDRAKDIQPSISTLGIWVYSKYLLTMIFFYCTSAFLIEYFSLSDIEELILLIGSSTILSFFLLLGIDSLISARK